VFFARKMN